MVDPCELFQTFLDHVLEIDEVELVICKLDDFCIGLKFVVTPTVVVA